MEDESPVIEVHERGSVLFPLHTLPEYDDLILQVESTLNCPPNSFVLEYQEPGGDVKQITNAEDLRNAFAAADLPLQILVKLVAEEFASSLCPYCNNPLAGNESLCPICKTVSWDVWFLNKYGDEKYHAYEDARPKPAKGFSFGPVDLTPQQKSVFEEEVIEASPRSPPDEVHDAEFLQGDDELSLSKPAEDFKENSFRASEPKFQTPPRKQKVANAQEVFRTSSGSDEFKPHERDSDIVIQGEDESAVKFKLSEKGLTDSPFIQGTAEARRYPTSRTFNVPGLHASPYLSPEKSSFHDRSRCNICQRSHRGASILLKQDEYTGSVFKASREIRDSWSSKTKETCESPSRVNYESPVRKYQPPTETKESYYRSRRNDYSPEPRYQSAWSRVSRDNHDIGGYRTSYYRSLNHDSVLPEFRRGARVWECEKCLNCPPWYFQSCRNCELTQSLAYQKEDNYKRRVEQWCKK